MNVKKNINIIISFVIVCAIISTGTYILGRRGAGNDSNIGYELATIRAELDRQRQINNELISGINRSQEGIDNSIESVQQLADVTRDSIDIVKHSRAAIQALKGD